MASISVPRKKMAFLDGRWTPEDSLRLYGAAEWGKGYVAINAKGHVEIRPGVDESRAIDLHDLMNDLQARGVTAPVLLRFPGIIEHRMRAIQASFDRAIAQESYQGGYCCVYPIKVNQQRQIVEQVRDVGATLGGGLEVGSKPELLGVLGMTTEHPQLPIICNGFKDDEFIETVLLATKLGRTIIPIVEKFSELSRIIHFSERFGVRPTIGVRAKITARGSGRWQSSGGARSKFGLFMHEILRAIDLLREHDMVDCLRLVHFHMGSQIADIRSLKNATTELAHIYCELRRLGAGVTMIDIGGGLGVDYDGSQTNSDSSINYSLDEYASDVVYRVKSVCDERKEPHPTIVSESGRALVAYSSVLVFDVLGVSRLDDIPPSDEEIESLRSAQAEQEVVPQPILDLVETRRNINDRNLLESYHDATQARDEAMSLFSMGYLSLPMRAITERLFWSIGSQILRRALRTRRELPEEFEELPAILSDHYFCNFSIFQSMPDAWAIDQLFPIMPIHRHNEEPTRRAVLADITCDSDGTIDRFVNKRDVKATLELHEPARSEPYRLAAFLVGAYQEILGDLHNLLGDTHAVHVEVDEKGEIHLGDIVAGDRVRDVLSYVQINHRALRRAMRADLARAVESGRLNEEDSRTLLQFYERGLDGYTYLEE